MGKPGFSRYKNRERTSSRSRSRSRSESRPRRNSFPQSEGGKMSPGGGKHADPNKKTTISEDLAELVWPEIKKIKRCLGHYEGGEESQKCDESEQFPFCEKHSCVLFFSA